MKISIISNNNIKPNRFQLNFISREVTDETILKEYALIEDAITQIQNNPNLMPTISTIATLTGITYTRTYNRLYSNSKQGKRLSSKLKELKEQRDANLQNVHSKHSNTKSLEEEDYKKIKQAIKEIRENDGYHLTQKQIAAITGIPKTTLSHRLAASNEHTREIRFMLNEARTYKSSRPLQQKSSYIPPQPGQRRYSDEEKLLAKESKEKAEKIRRYTKALRLINNAIGTGGKISYKELENQCSLTREEIDELIEKYAKFRIKQQEEEKAAKKFQAKWYEENKNEY